METAEPSSSEQEFLCALDELRTRYSEQPFWCERDVVCWLQRRLTLSCSGSLRVFNDFGMLPGPRRALSADLAIVDGNEVLLAAEFKYEPAKTRNDIKPNKLPVTGPVDYFRDVARIESFVIAGKTPVAWAIFIDEGGRYRAQERSTHPLAHRMLGDRLRDARRIDPLASASFRGRSNRSI